MTGQNFSTRQPGQPFWMGAAEINTFIAASKAFQQGNRPQGFGDITRMTDPVLVNVHNDSGSLVERGGVLGIKGATFDPAASIDEFFNCITVDGETPTTASHTGLFVVAVEPIPAGTIGKAVASGLAHVLLEVADADHQWADVTNSSAAKLTTGFTGSARIVWKQSGTGEKWAIVRLSNASTGVVDNPHELEGFDDDTEAPYTGDTWDRSAPPTGTRGVKVPFMRRVVYNEAGDQVLYRFQSFMIFDDKGCLAEVTGEERGEVNTPDEDCTVTE